MQLLRRFNDEAVLGGFTDYLRYELRRSAPTVKAYGHQLIYVSRALGKQVTQVSPKDIRYEVKRDESVAVSTRNLRIASYRQLHGWGLLEEAVWAQAAMLGVKSLPEIRAPKPPLRLEDARKALDGCRVPNDYRAVYLTLYGGLRVAEAASITHRHVCGDRLTFVGKGQYGGKERSVPIHPALREALPIILSETPKSKDVLADRFSKLRDRLDLRNTKGEKATHHSLRRCFADLLYDKKGVPREVVQALLGHGSSVTDLYAPVRFPKMQEAILLLDFTWGTPVQLSFF